ncbi:hypothetical protein [Rickettsiales endosymbiont of Stachyamoeba lipophora]|uniref:hypothetical protein n=1 Tax=Rickettsiales endosymbiont of Stachyamoeba lipophora TaxID=2486578 RepID=UPI000F64C527|nr:hypothetical protein [Rickettsiales endosymbiont of Stachyamoeba lipophora]AZL14963.1 hypothetical protein EF513_00050 [Rickettsiales endosymbiont of Stachyamoeba lipophora]
MQYHFVIEDFVSATDPKVYSLIEKAYYNGKLAFITEDSPIMPEDFKPVANLRENQFAPLKYLAESGENIVQYINSAGYYQTIKISDENPQFRKDFFTKSAEMRTEKDTNVYRDETGEEKITVVTKNLMHYVDQNGKYQLVQINNENSQLKDELEKIWDNLDQLEEDAPKEIFNTTLYGIEGKLSHCEFDCDISNIALDYLL